MSQSYYHRLKKCLVWIFLRFFQSSNDYKIKFTVLISIKLFVNLMILFSGHKKKYYKNAIHVSIYHELIYIVPNELKKQNST